MGYVLTQVPSNMVITKVRPGVYISSWMLIWAAVSGKLERDHDILILGANGMES